MTTITQSFTPSTSSTALMTPPATVVVADDHTVVRAGLRHILESSPEVTVIAEANNAASALQLAREHRPDIMILDITMPGGSGLSVLPTIRAEVPDTRVLMLSVHDDAEYLEESIRSGAHGYLRKDSAATDLRTAVSTILSGERFFAESPAPSSAAPSQAAEPAVRVTIRERQVLVRVARGCTSKQIAAELGISPRTVETHRENLTRKLGISSVAGLTRYALEHGFTDDA